MSNESDETSLVRTLPPHEFPSERAVLDFDWRVDLSDRAEAAIRRSVLDTLKSAELDGIPAVAIVRRLGISLDSDAIDVDVYDGLGKRICVVRIAEDGFGELNLLI